MVIASVRRKSVPDLLFHIWAGRGVDAVVMARSIAGIIPLQEKVGSSFPVP